MTLASNEFQDAYAETCGPEHVRVKNKHQTQLLDATYKAAD
jgi:hypothetical protein